MHVLDLFSGIGGFSLGLEAAGMETVAFCEVSPVCRHLLAHHWPKVPCYDDVQTLTAERLAADGIGVDVICGGFPCQDASVANTSGRLGVDGSRTGLVFEYLRLIGELRPRVVIMENVAGLLSRGVGRVLGGLASLGYDAWWRPIRASAAGAPHGRQRLWIVAYAAGQGRQGFEQIVGALERTVATLPVNDNAFADAWRALDGDLSDLLPGDGLSVSLERLRLHQTGNAVVPAIPEALGRAILEALNPS